jgi:hypothetical protein
MMINKGDLIEYTAPLTKIKYLGIITDLNQSTFVVAWIQYTPWSERATIFATEGREAKERIKVIQSISSPS